jgi:hypothetical protein
MIGLLNTKGEFLLSLPKNNGVLFHYRMMGNLKRLGFELIDKWYEIENSYGEIEQDNNLRVIELLSRDSFIKKLIKREKYQRNRNFVTISSYYSRFEDLVSGVSAKVTVSSNSGLKFVLH